MNLKKIHKNVNWYLVLTFRFLAKKYLKHHYKGLLGNIQGIGMYFNCGCWCNQTFSTITNNLIRLHMLYCNRCRSSNFDFCSLAANVHCTIVWSQQTFRIQGRIYRSAITKQSKKNRNETKWKHDKMHIWGSEEIRN